MNEQESRSAKQNILFVQYASLLKMVQLTHQPSQARVALEGSETETHTAVSCMRGLGITLCFISNNNADQLGTENFEIEHKASMHIKDASDIFRPIKLDLTIANLWDAP